MSDVDYQPGMTLRHRAYSGQTVKLIKKLEDGRFLVQRERCKTRVSPTTLDREYDVVEEQPGG